MIFTPTQARRHRKAFGTMPTQITACAPPNEKCAIPSEDCAPKKATILVPLKCSILVINPVFVGKNRFFCRFRNEDLFLWSLLSNSREKSFGAPLKVVYAPLPSHATLAPSLRLLLCFLYLLFTKKNLQSQNIVKIFFSFLQTYF